MRRLGWHHSQFVVRAAVAPAGEQPRAKAEDYSSMAPLLPPPLLRHLADPKATRVIDDAPAHL
eukprot:NODE_22345_length_712_cov_2.153846.p2 GENE.NODE_22345_length_712_cov_2.153846~~NODE_22345_length_712_cov_2.153846.p2  ORF type:complete len:63 (-),score=13.11 NODE_22345_length_712_cov_2.153846:317-505(-)